MSGKVTIEVTRGESAQRTYTYTEKERIFIGRQEDCGIVLAEHTVSRYHCVLEILPPEVKLQDFGSLNGTFLNGVVIGKRDKDQSLEQAKEEDHEVYTLKDGDLLGLGTHCELCCRIEAFDQCAHCGATLPKAYLPTETIPENAEPTFYDADGRRICRACSEEADRLAQERLEEIRRQEEAARQEAERLEQEKLNHAAALAAEQEKQRLAELERQRQAELEKQRLAEQEKQRLEALEQQRLEAQKKKDETRACATCGKPFVPTATDNNLCPDCLKDRGKVIDAILGNLIAGAAPQEKAVGPSLLRGYVKVKLLGKGGMGEVWKVRQESTGKLFALKTMLPHAAADTQSKRLFLREAEIGKVLQHKNVIRTYEAGSANGVLYVLMDLCEGGSVDELMESKGGRLPLEQATWIMLQVLAGLDYVHHVDLSVPIQKGLFKGSMEAHGVVHRDFKPGNIFLASKEEKPVALVADFGMAKAFDAAGISRVTKSGAVMGTPVFMPRQQAMDTKYAKPEVDVWAASASYYNMLTGTFPKNFRLGVNPYKVIVGESAVPIGERGVDIPKPLASVIDRALCERPEIGYQSAAKLRKDLIAALPDSLRNEMKGVL